MKTNVIEKIRLLRLQKGYSQENMADLLGLSTTAYGDLERGKTELTLSRLQHIAAALDIELTTLLTDAALPAPTAPDLTAQLETQQLEIEKLRLEIAHWKRKYQDQLTAQLARQLIEAQPPRERIGF